MLNQLLGIDESQNVTNIDVFLRGGWILGAVLIAISVAFIFYLYRSEDRLSTRRRVVLGICQGLALLTLIVVVLEPVADIEATRPYQRTMLVLLDTSRSMAISDPRSAPEDVGEAAKVLGKVPLEGSLAPDRLDTVRGELAEVSRLDLAKAALQHKDISLIEKLEKEFQVRFFTFDGSVQPEGGADKPLEWLAKSEADGDTSAVGSAIDEAVARYAGQQLAGVVVLSDFAWVQGKDPAKVGRELSQRGIPVYTVPVGLPAPPDVRVRRVIAPEVVFQGDRVPIRVQIESDGFEGKNVELVLSIDGQRTTSEPVELEGGVQFAEVMFIPQQESGTLSLALTVSALTGEITTENNELEHKVRILDEKIRVLYVEGMPRWEYRYLRWVLLRDPRLDVTFLMTQGDPALAATSPRHVARFPQDAEDVLKYDLVILGDVPATYFASSQLELIETLVKTGGGSLLMLAGPMAAPTTYIDTPSARILPVKIGDGSWKKHGGNVYPVLTAAGRESDIGSLSVSEQSNDAIWSKVKPMYELPRLAGAKPGATVLLSLPKVTEELADYPLVAWHRYGNGKSLFVGTEDLWRMRLEVGDRYHARFWGQTIQFLTLSRLLGQNKQISLETDRRTYSSGEQVLVYANVLSEYFEPIEEPTYTVILERQGDADSAAELELTPVPDTPGLYSGAHLAGGGGASGDGSFTLRTRPRDADVSNRAEFEVATVPLEDRETAAHAEVAAQLASLTGGKTMSLSELRELPGILGEEEDLSRVVRMEMDLWDTPILFIALVLFAGMEWFMRRRDNLV